MTTPLENWIFHIIAGILGVVFSLSVVYMKFEQKFSVHQKLKRETIRSITHDNQALSREEEDQFIARFNRLTFLGTNTKYIPNMSNAAVIEFVHGGRLHVASGDKFIEVKRVDKKGRVKYYWLLENRNEMIYSR